MSPSQKIGIRLSLLCALCLCLFACGSDKSNAPATARAATATPSPRSTSATDSASSDSHESEVADDDTGDDKEDSDTEAEDFHGYRCTVDCSGHEAGYRWAEEHEIHDPDDCGGKSESFIEGCRAWAEENPADEEDPEGS